VQESELNCVPSTVKRQRTGLIYTSNQQSEKHSGFHFLFGRVRSLLSAAFDRPFYATPPRRSDKVLGALV
jgi:hypothetical protein